MMTGNERLRAASDGTSPAASFESMLPMIFRDVLNQSLPFTGRNITSGFASRSGFLKTGVHTHVAAEEDLFPICLDQV